VSREDTRLCLDQPSRKEPKYFYLLRFGTYCEEITLMRIMRQNPIPALEGDIQVNSPNGRVPRPMSTLKVTFMP
jgi:hypothetical protein